jgi:hypothetical protein
MDGEAMSLAAGDGTVHVGGGDRLRGGGPVLVVEAWPMLAGAPSVTQRVRAGRDTCTARRDQAIISPRHPGE